MIRDEQQTRKRINRIIQTRQTYIYALLFKDSRVEKMIYDRQHKKTYMMQLALNHKKIEVEKITRDVDNDENDDSRLAVG
jgi:SNF2 family DNA or RNA helicase